MPMVDFFERFEPFDGFDGFDDLEVNPVAVMISMC
jgi:hypothetical protein